MKRRVGKQTEDGTVPVRRPSQYNIMTVMKEREGEATEDALVGQKASQTQKIIECSY